jgi:DNA-binding SARP family transcriptional activator
LCTEALNSGIETAHVMQMIRAHALMPPPAIPCPAWPWPVRVHVLGRFEVRINGEALSFGGKAPKKPLELLKALVVKGPAAVEQDVLAQELWPDSDGDAAESAVRMALHRLRKLLGGEGFILVQGGKLQLNPASSWVDAWEFERTCRALESTKPLVNMDQAVRALALYAGEAFANEALQPWMLPAHDRWRSAFLRAVRVAGQARESAAQWQEAAATYESGIRADPLCEDFYQSLMLSFLKQGKAAEAYATYRRCRDALSITLGVKPSAKTEALRQQIAMQGAA